MVSKMHYRSGKSRLCLLTGSKVSVPYYAVVLKRWVTKYLKQQFRRHPTSRSQLRYLPDLLSSPYVNVVWQRLNL